MQIARYINITYIKDVRSIALFNQFLMLFRIFLFFLFICSNIFFLHFRNNIKKNYYGCNLKSTDMGLPILVILKIQMSQT